MRAQVFLITLSAVRGTRQESRDSPTRDDDIVAHAAVECHALHHKSGESFSGMSQLCNVLFSLSSHKAAQQVQGPLVEGVACFGIFCGMF
jgi:hypothetical protein